MNESITRNFHMSVDIQGVLRRSDNELGKLFIDEDGRHKPGRYVRDWLKLQLAHGKKVLPMGKPCEGFSYQTGCPGHPNAQTFPQAETQSAGKEP